MDDKERTLNEAMLCVMSALFVDMTEGSEVSGDEVRRAMWPKGVPKVAEVVARNCLLAVVGTLNADPSVFEQVGAVLYMELAAENGEAVTDDPTSVA